MMLVSMPSHEQTFLMRVCLHGLAALACVAVSWFRGMIAREYATQDREVPD